MKVLSGFLCTALVVGIAATALFVVPRQAHAYAGGKYTCPAACPGPNDTVPLDCFRGACMPLAGTPA